jgi:hypothetical protein
VHVQVDQAWEDRHSPQVDGALRSGRHDACRWTACDDAVSIDDNGRILQRLGAGPINEGAIHKSG